MSFPESPAKVEVSPYGLGTVAPMFTSPADVFRTRQALRDLAEAVRSNSVALARLGTTENERKAIESIVDAGGRIQDASGRV